MATALLGAAMATVGCGSTTYQKFDLTVALDEDFARETRGASTTVDVVALSEQRAQTIENMSMRAYWTEGHPTRQGLLSDDVVWTTELSAADLSATLPATHPIWNSPTWRTGGTLLILADLPGVGPRDNMDPRRLALPRDSQLWDARNLEVIFSRGQPRYSPQEKVSGQ